MAWRHERSDEPGCPSNDGARFVNVPWSARELVLSLAGVDTLY